MSVSVTEKAGTATIRVGVEDVKNATEAQKRMADVFKDAPAGEYKLTFVDFESPIVQKGEIYVVELDNDCAVLLSSPDPSHKSIVAQLSKLAIFPSELINSTRPIHLHLPGFKRTEGFIIGKDRPLTILNSSNRISIAESISHITGNLYVGNCYAAKNAAELGFSHVFDIGGDAPANKCNYTNVGTFKDLPDVKILPFLAKNVSRIDRALKRGKVLLVCKQGQSRSPSAAVHYLMHRQNMNFQEAMELVSKRRPCTQINRSFCAQLNGTTMDDVDDFTVEFTMAAYDVV